MTNQIKTISIVTRTCNRPALIERCFEHVLAAAPANAEWIIVNDSGDPSERVRIEEQVTDFAHKAAFEIRLVNLQSAHRTRALNAGFDAATGKYLHIIDDDDTVHPTIYKAAIDFLDAPSNQSWGAVAVRCERVDEILTDGVYLAKRRLPHYPELQAISLAGMATVMTTPTCSLIFRRDLIGDMRFDESFVVAEDHEFLLRFLLKHDIALLDEVLCAYHQRVESSGGDANSEITRRHQVEAVRFRNALLRRDIAEGRIGLGWLVTMADMNRGNLRLNLILERMYRIDPINRLFQWFRR